MRKISETKKRSIQLRFLHYLKNYRDKKNISQGGLAEELGVAVSLIGLFESKSTDNRLISSFEFLYSLANLEGVSLKEFVTLIEEGGAKSSSLSWQDGLSESFSKLDFSLQFKLFEVFKNLKADQEKTAAVFTLFIEACSKDIKQIQLFNQILREFK